MNRRRTLGNDRRSSISISGSKSPHSMIKILQDSSENLIFRIANSSIVIARKALDINCLYSKMTTQFLTKSYQNVDHRC